MLVPCSGREKRRRRIPFGQQIGIRDSCELRLAIDGRVDEHRRTLGDERVFQHVAQVHPVFPHRGKLDADGLVPIGNCDILRSITGRAGASPRDEAFGEGCRCTGRRSMVAPHLRGEVARGSEP